VIQCTEKSVDYLTVLATYLDKTQINSQPLSRSQMALTLGPDIETFITLAVQHLSHLTAQE
jgi:hypothetical protein